jgi:hypothetical protein
MHVYISMHACVHATEDRFIHGCLFVSVCLSVYVSVQSYSSYAFLAIFLGEMFLKFFAMGIFGKSGVCLCASSVQRTAYQRRCKK